MCVYVILQFVDKNGAHVKMTTIPAKFADIASSPATVPAVTTPTIPAASPVIMHSPSTSMMRATPTPVTPATKPVYYVQISGGAPSKPVLVRPIRQHSQQQIPSPVVKIVDGPILSHTQSGSHGDQQASSLNGTKTQKSSDNTKDPHTMYFANQVKDMGTNISVKMGATYNMVSEYTLISKFEEAWNKLNELAAQWQQQKQSKKPTVTKATERPSVGSGRDKVVMVAQQQQPQQIVQIPQQQQTLRQLPQQQHQTVQLVPISAPQHATTPVVHGDVVSVLPSPAHVISTPGHTPVVIPAVARTGSEAVTYYSIPPKANMTTGAIHPQKNKDEVYMVQVVKPVAPVMPVTPVMSMRSSEKRTAQQCDVCSKKASFLCSGCQSAWYCGRSCQVRQYSQ